MVLVVVVGVAKLPGLAVNANKDSGLHFLSFSAAGCRMCRAL